MLIEKVIATGVAAVAVLFLAFVTVLSLLHRKDLAITTLRTNVLVWLTGWLVLLLSLTFVWVYVFVPWIPRIWISVPLPFNLIVILVGLVPAVLPVSLGAYPLTRYIDTIGAKRKVGVIGLTSSSLTFVQALADVPGARYEFVGFLGSSSEQVSIHNLGFRYLGEASNLKAVSEREHLDILAYGDFDQHIIEQLTDIDRSLRVELVTVLELYERMSSRVMLGSLSKDPDVVLSKSSPAYDVIKRIFDMVFSLGTLLLFSPLLVMVSIAVKLDSPGPVFFYRQVMGRNGTLFKKYKFRTMATDLPLGVEVGVAPRPYRTRVGRVLARMNLDELPQLYNVLRGEMSIIGPRADMPTEIIDREEKLRAYQQRFSVKPGITGWAFVNYAYQSPSPDLLRQLEYDLYYVKHRSLLLDWLIWLRTINTVLAGPEWPGMESQFRKSWVQASSALLDARRDAFDQAIDRIAGQLGQKLGFSVASRREECRYLSLRELNSGSAFESLLIPTNIPLMFLRSAQFLSADVDDIRALLTRCYGENFKFALLIVFLEGDAFDRMSRELEEKLRRVYAYDIVPISRQDLQLLASSDQPVRALLRFILARADLRRWSPFVVTGSTPDNMFFGREREIQLMVDRARNVTHAIIGGRRVGKTSVLHRLNRVRLPAIGLHSIYLDCSPTFTYEALLATAVRGWQPDSPDVFTTLGVALRSSPTEEPFVLLLDEADKLVAIDRANTWRLFNMLRASVNSGRLQIIFSGERTLRDALRDPSSPLFNFANEILLGPLDFRAVEELVTRPMKQLEIELADVGTIVRRIYDFTSGHPNVVQRLCHRLIERLNELDSRRLTLDDVNAVIEDPAFQRDDFLSTYWEAATPLERIITLLMAGGENERTLRTVRETLAHRCNLRPNARDIDGALQRLVDLRSILKRTPGGYQFAVEAFPRVVAGTMTLDDMLEILTEEYQEQSE